MNLVVVGSVVFDSLSLSFTLTRTTTRNNLSHYGDTPMTHPESTTAKLLGAEYYCRLYRSY